MKETKLLERKPLHPICTSQKPFSGTGTPSSRGGNFPALSIRTQIPKSKKLRGM